MDLASRKKLLCPVSKKERIKSLRPISKEYGIFFVPRQESDIRMIKNIFEYILV